MRRWWVRALLLCAGGLSVAWWSLGRMASSIPSPPAPPALFARDTPAAQLVRAALRNVERSPAEPGAWYELGLAYEANGAVDPARACMLECVRQAPGHPRAWYHLALLEEHLGQLDAAIEALERSLALDAEYVPAWWRLGDLLLDRDDVEDAERAFLEAHRRYPDALRGLVGVARAKLRGGQAAEAAALLRPHAAANVPDALLHQTYAAALARQGLAARVDAIPLHARTPAPEPPDPWLAEAERYRADRRKRADEATQLATRGRYDEAIALLEALRRDEPSNAATLCNLIAAHRAKGDLRRSAALGEEAVRLFPDAHQPYLNLALTRLAIGALPDGTTAPHELAIAVRLVDAAIARNPSSAAAHGLRGQLHRAVGEHASAVASYRKAAVAAPADPTWVAERGRSELDAGDPTQASETLRLAVAALPRRGDLLELYADALRAAGRLAESNAARAQAATLARGTGGAAQPPGAAPTSFAEEGVGGAPR